MNDRCTLLMIGNFLSKHSRSRSVCEDLAERLMESGWKVFTTSDKLGRVERMLDTLNVIWTRRGEYNIATIDTFSGLSFFWTEMAGLLLNLLKKPYILILHGGNLPEFARRWPHRVVRLLKSAAAVTAPSRYLFEKMQAYRSDLLLLPNPINLKKYRFVLRDKPRPLLVWLRAFENIYNAPLAVQVARCLIPDYPHFLLHMGGGDYGNGRIKKIRRLANTLGIADFVQFAGRIPKDEVPIWLQQGDIFINTTNVDNTPISVLEAMACGLCVVSTNVGGIPYLLDDGITALLVPPNHTEAMADAVRQILVDPGLSKRLSENARKKAEQFDWDVILPQWENLLDAYR